jgi:hypothetical protein
MRKYRSLIIFFIIVLLIGGAAIYFINFYTPPEDDTEVEDTTEDTTVSIISYGDDLSTFSFTLNEVKYEFKKEDTEWVISEPEDYKYDEDIINSLAGYLGDLTADKEVGEVENLADFGLEEPVFEITIKNAEDEEAVIQIGDMTPVETGYYAKLKDEDKVYVISTYTGEAMILDASSIRSKDLFPSESTDFKAISVEKDGDVSYSAKYVDENEWTITAPIKADTKDDTFITMAETLAGVSIVSFESDVEDSDCGLDKPSYKLTYKTEKSEKTILFGKEKVKGTSIYAKVEGKDEIFLLSLDTLTFLDTKITDVASTLIAIPNIDDVTKMTVTADGEEHVSKITTSDDEESENADDKFVFDGVDIKKDEDTSEEADDMFRQYYQAVIGVAFEEIEIDAEPEGDAEVKIIYELSSDPGKITVELISKNDEYYYAMKDGNYTGTIVSKESVKEGLITSTEEMVEFAEKLK